MFENIILLLFAVVVAACLFHPAIRDSRDWRATVTPLASIIGSGFLVAAPLLYQVVNGWSVLAMAGIVLLAYAIGGVIRYNIRYAEPALAAASGWSLMATIETVASVVLSVGYVISVAFYLRLLASFVLRMAAVENELLANGITTVMIAFIAVIGLWRGLGGLERLEETAVNIKLSIIVALLAGLAWFDFTGWITQSIDLLFLPVTDWHDSLRRLAGILLIIQGFETSRYLGSEYDAETRIRTMRYAQWLSGLIYLLFIALVLPLLGPFQAAHGETAIIAIAALVAPVLPAMLTGAAVMSQFSAAVADTAGSGGLMAEVSGRRITPGRGYLLISAVAMVLVWSASIFEIITIASRAFAAYYLLQCLVAVMVSVGRRDFWRALLFLMMALVLLWIAVFAIPAAG